MTLRWRCSIPCVSTLSWQSEGHPTGRVIYSMKWVVKFRRGYGRTMCRMIWSILFMAPRMKNDSKINLLCNVMRRFDLRLPVLITHWWLPIWVKSLAYLGQVIGHHQCVIKTCRTSSKRCIPFQTPLSSKLIFYQSVEYRKCGLDWDAGVIYS